MNKFDDTIEMGESPLIIVHGTEDHVVMYDLAELIRQHAHRAWLPYDFYPIEGAGHYVNFFWRDPLSQLTVLDRVVNFFYLFVGPPAAVELDRFDLTARDGGRPFGS